jgi:adenosylmethionine-8-amino-7-oxononanoate aminotransferase
VTEKVGIRKPFESLLKTDNVSYVSTPNIYRGIRDGENIEEYVNRLAKELEDGFQRIGPQTVCAFIVETFTSSVNKPRAKETLRPG